MEDSSIYELLSRALTKEGHVQLTRMKPLFVWPYPWPAGAARVIVARWHVPHCAWLLLMLFLLTWALFLQLLIEGDIAAFSILVKNVRTA